MKIIERELNEVKEELKSAFNDIDVLDGALKEFVLSGSKFIRSLVATLYIKSQGGSFTGDICKILCAGELIHNASLLHDDVIDGADIRRGKTTISKMFSSKISILAGDFLLSKAIEKLLALNDDEILNSFKNSTQKMAVTELKQYFLRGSIPNSFDYIEICKGKTASLFTAILESCAKTLGHDLQKAKLFAENYGLCFQIRNDLELNSADIDKKNGIHTAIDVLGIEKTNILLDNCKKEMKNILNTFEDSIYKEELEVLIESL